MNVRIGNDIKLNILLNNLEFYTEEDIKQMHVYLVNDSVDLELDFNRFTERSRYPREPFTSQYDATYNYLNACGRHSYHVHPVNDIPFLGDSLHSKPVRHHHNRQYNDFMAQCFSQFVYPDGMVNPEHQFKYLAYSELDLVNKTVNAYFPALDQVSLGTYKIVVVYTTYEEGWGTTNMHVHTKEFADVFTLVDDQDGASGYVTISVKDWEDPTMITAIAGFSTATSIKDIDIEQFTRVDEDDTASITNDTHGAYLWICCPKEAKQFTSGGFVIPMSSTVQFKDKYYCYRSYGQLQKGDVSFKINY